MGSEGGSSGGDTSPNAGCAVCGVAAAVLYCAADAAALCTPCDAAIHAANPLASRHHRVPLSSAAAMAASGVYDYDSLFAGDDEAGSTLTPPGQGSPNSGSSSFSSNGGSERSLFELLSDVDLMATDAAAAPLWMMMQPGMDAAWSLSEGVVVPSGAGAGFPSLVGGGAMVAADREEKVRRYREKREKRKFHKTIRYASRKAYAEARPRIKGRFVKRAAAEESDHDSTNGGAEGSKFWLSFSDADSRDGSVGFQAPPAYGVVPSSF
ncbi:zinc finger protein CONSTANS-LIKE 2 [Brachypodium distachyon]|uniref:CCT domain-containing protein n=1 Tax=Brachypodium distachyon TaxID=15368 RepID=I1I2B4_BRADI|nr:zinc finger protein CONSTANS-LIKE 2 [Brachypodium distachyon]KQJ95789.1 hypothetical protein BRADI_3g19010v3 [Brachypodium distachyon]|eukprot:XP_003571579.1 zinc finger protein CONSTANS-LIKE 2 [Brachypodium distachyon]